jgi:hypothetical protein
MDAGQACPLPKSWASKCPHTRDSRSASTIARRNLENESLTNAQWDTNFPKIYTWMLEEGRTMRRVKVVLEDVFHPNDLFFLKNVHLGVTIDMVKYIKELNFGYSNDWSYNTCHHGLSPFVVISISMATVSKQCRCQADHFTRTSQFDAGQGSTIGDLTGPPTNGVPWFG